MTATYISVCRKSTLSTMHVCTAEPCNPSPMYMPETYQSLMSLSKPTTERTAPE